MEQFLTLLLNVKALYFILGILFTIAFLIKGITKVDALTADTGFVFKLLIFPGLVTLWPIFLVKWIKSSKVNRV